MKGKRKGGVKMFWKKRPLEEEAKKEKLLGPKELPGSV